MGYGKRAHRPTLFDSLESRELLSLAAKPALEVRSVHQTIVLGTITGTFQAQGVVSSFGEAYALSGRGSVSGLGPVALQGVAQQFPVHGLFTILDVSASLSTARRGGINVTFGGEGEAGPRPEVFPYRGMAGSVVGGTGHFAQAEGTVTANITLSSKVPGFTSGHFTLAIKIRLTTA